MQQEQRPTSVTYACRVVNAYVSNNTVAPEGVLELLDELISATVELSRDSAPQAPSTYLQTPGNRRGPAAPIETSVADDYIVCLEDGLRFKSLRRHLNQKYGMTPDDYRAKWGLPSTYPMVAPAHARARSELAKAREQRKRDQARRTERSKSHRS
jgi:predicted transcriptional regulator